MPVTFQPAKHPAKPFPPQPQEKRGEPRQVILQGACHDQYQKCAEIFQSSLDQQALDKGQEILPRQNGFVQTVVEAYNHHHALVIRPDDVWLSILTQFSFFVNGNAEQLRKQFVSHEGKEELEITAGGSRYSVDFGSMARQMTKLIDENVVDPSLREWIIPSFSTTTMNDTTVASMVMMATMKEYFSFGISLMCGIPRVTLEGEKSDWQNILSRIEKLKEYGDETTAWYTLLFPVLSRFVTAFDNPNSQKNLDFWQKVAHYQGGGSGPTWLAGWINAFCVFDSKGNWKGYAPGKYPEPPNEFMTSLGGPRPQRYLTLEDAVYHRTDTNEIPQGFVEVDVKLNDNGQKFDTTMVAGLVGTLVCDSGDKSLSEEGKRDTAKSFSAWWIFARSPNGETGENPGDNEEVRQESSYPLQPERVPKGRKIRNSLTKGCVCA